MDFTIKIYKHLLESLQNAGFSFLTFAEYVEIKEKGIGKMESETRNLHPVKLRSENFTGAKHGTRNTEHGTRNSKLVILRHDVDALPQNSLRFARIQAEMGIKGTYYFRAVSQSWDEEIIKEIHSLGHEVGYHYENMDVASKKLQRKTGNRQPTLMKYSPSSNFTGQATDNLIDFAYEDFKVNLEKLRKLVPVSTICMHGSPLSKFDNRDIWKKYSYKKLGLLAEPYFDIDFNQLFYLTDTGRRWDGHRFNVRDKPMAQAGEGASKRPDSYRDGDSSSKRRSDNTSSHSSIHSYTHSSIHPSNHSPIQPSFSSTHEIIAAIGSGTFPSHAMLNFHPQRWHSKPLPWLKEFIWQNVKNQGKRVLIAARRNK